MMSVTARHTDRIPATQASMYPLHRVAGLVCGLSILWSASIMAQPLPSYAPYFRTVLTIPDRYVNDHCLIFAHGLWHLFFIEGTVSSMPWSRPGNEVLIGHATSSDLIDWLPQRPALSTGPVGSLDASHVYAPYVVERDGLYYMMYTGAEGAFANGEHLFLATSTDLYNWSRYSAAPILLPDTSWALYHPQGYNGTSGGPVSSRDPHILRNDRYGYVCYYVTMLKATPSHPGRDGEYSCVAAATSRDLIHWVDHGPVLVRPTLVGADSIYLPPESPCVVERNGSYYLFWKGERGTWYTVSDDPLDFTKGQEGFLATSHASEVFSWGREWYITSCSRDLDDIRHEYSDRTRGLFIAGLTWDGTIPRVSFLPDVLRMAPITLPDETTRPSYDPSIYLDVPSSVSDTLDTAFLTDLPGRTVRLPTPVQLTTDVMGNRKIRIPIDTLPPGTYLIAMGNDPQYIGMLVRYEQGIRIGGQNYRVVF